MDYNELVEQITRLVMEEVERTSRAAGTAPSPGGEKVLVLVDPGMEEFEPFFSGLAREGTPGTRYTLVMPRELEESARAGAGLFPYDIVADPPRSSYKALLGGTDRVVIPHLSVTALNKLANLIGDEPVAGIAMEALLQGVAVTACTDYVHGLNFGDSSPSQKVFALIRRSLETIREMGVSTVQMGKIGAEMTKTVQKPVSGGKRHVVTNEDVFVAADQKQKILNFPRGTIVTPLAWDTAKSLDIEIRLV